MIDMNDDIHKFCVSFVSIQVASFGLETVVASWNEHIIPGNTDLGSFQAAHQNFYIMQFYLINREMEEIFAFSWMVGKVAYINSVKKIYT